MRIVFSCRPAYGHLRPLLPLATAARADGHPGANHENPAVYPTLDYCV